MEIIPILITWVVITISLVIISKLPLGVEIDSWGKAFLSGAVFGVLNAIGQWLVTNLRVINFLTLGLFGLILNIIIFGLAAKLVVGFRLKWGIWSAILGAFVLAIVISVVNYLVGLVLPTAL